MIRFTRSRKTSISANGGTHTIDYSITSGKELAVIELFASTDTSLQKIEVLYSENNGSTWINPWDADSDVILQVWVGAGVPTSGKPEATWFSGGANRLIRLKITNLHPTTTANVFVLIKGWERSV